MRPVNRIVMSIFNRFDWKALQPEEKKVLQEGIVKHKSVLRVALLIMPVQIALAVIAPEIMLVLTAFSFILLLLGGAWHVISFQNVAQAQLDAGVADYITKRMFRAFILSFERKVRNLRRRQNELSS